jgi:hypothetical protein
MLVIDRQTLPEPLLSFIGAERIRVEGETDKIVLTPVVDGFEPEEYDIDPDDYPDTTAYFNAIPGAVERLLAYRNLPDSEFEEWDLCIDTGRPKKIMKTEDILLIEERGFIGITQGGVP